jgi:hypothetical protein
MVVQPEEVNNSKMFVEQTKDGAEDEEEVAEDCRGEEGGVQPKEGESVNDWVDRVFDQGAMMVFTRDTSPGSVVVAESVDLEDDEAGCVSVQFYG